MLDYVLTSYGRRWRTTDRTWIWEGTERQRVIGGIGIELNSEYTGGGFAV